MNAVEQHIENMFRDFPETEEIKRIKNDLYQNAQDRYDELIALGKTESEALGTIIIEIGERDVLLEELGYDQEEDLMDYSFHTLAEAENYIMFTNRESTKIGLGILLILVGVGLTPTFNTFGVEEIGVILLLICVAVAVGIFITAGLRLESLKNALDPDEGIFYLSHEDYETIEYEFSVFKERERYRIPMGVMLCILAVIPLLLFSFLDQQLITERFGILLLTTAIGTGVYQFVKYGMLQSAYEQVLNIGEYSVEERRFQQKIEPIAGIYWLGAVLVYFIWSFTTMNWHYTWMIWPISGILWALISLFLKTWSNRESDR